MSGDDTWLDRPVAVTGAAGLLGAALVRLLDRHGAAVVGIDHDEQRIQSARAAWPPGAPDVAVGDVTDVDSVTHVLRARKTSVVFHAAAQPLVGSARDDPLKTLDVNVRGTWTVLEACRRVAGVEAVVVMSSDKAYGRPEQLPYREEDGLRGEQVYEASKVAAEAVCRPYVVTYGLPVALARSANLFGPGDLHWTRLVPGTARAALEGVPPVIRSDGSPLRDYLFVDDAANGLLMLAAALTRGQLVGEAVNFGTAAPVSVTEMVERVLRAAGRTDLEPEVQGGAADEIPVQSLAFEKAEQRLGWRPRSELDDALERTVTWYRAFLAPTPRRSP